MYFTIPMKTLSASLPKRLPPVVSAATTWPSDEESISGTKAAKQLFRNMVTKTNNSTREEGSSPNQTICL